VSRHHVKRLINLGSGCLIVTFDVIAAGNALILTRPNVVSQAALRLPQDSPIGGNGAPRSIDEVLRIENGLLPSGHNRLWPRTEIDKNDPKRTST
jgi:hypothetical protein